MVEQVNSATSWQLFKPNKMKSYDRRNKVCSSSKAARAQARQLLRCIVRHICFIHLDFRSKIRVFWLSGRTECSCVTSKKFCRRLARLASSKLCWPTWFVVTVFRRKIVRTLHESRVICEWQKSSSTVSAIVNARCIKTLKLVLVRATCD